MTTDVDALVNELGLKFVNGIAQGTSGQEKCFHSKKVGYSQSDSAKRLFYKLKSALIRVEETKPSFDPQILNNEIFIKSLFACAGEIVLFSSHRSHFKFPWILKVLDLSPFHFYRIIEVVVREDEILNRDIVKHLNNVEEGILEGLAWSSRSPLWKSLIESKLPVPPCEDVSLECVSFEAVTESTVNGQQDSVTTHSSSKPSPSPSLSEKFLSPGKRSHGEAEAGVTPVKRPHLSPPAKENSSSPPKPKRTGAVALFFRKFYLLASSRLQAMCEQLKLAEDLRFKIWTCFEHTIVNHVELMYDRHLDQLLMCSIYVICKVVGVEKAFMDLLKCYRNQPQAQSQVYRSVLISPNRSWEDIKGLVGSGEGNGEAKLEKDDIISFYNKIFVEKIKKELAQKFKGNIDKERLVLSPLPVIKNISLNSPRRRISENHSIFLQACSPDTLKASPFSPMRQLSYCFSKSPAKDLQAINNMINIKQLKVGKQLFRDDEQEGSTTGRAISKKVQDLSVERMRMSK